MAGLFGGSPKPQPAATMPDSQSPDVLEAQRKAQQGILARAGRQSTILTTAATRPSNANYDSYSSRTLGAGS